MMTTATPELRRDEGLAHTIAADTQMSFIDGGKGVLEYVGIDIDTLARNSTFEETVFLLWNRRLPTRTELDEFSADIGRHAELPDPMWDLVRALPKTSAPMHTLRTLVSALALFDDAPDDLSPESLHHKSMVILASTPVLITAFDRHRKGLASIRPDASRSVAENFLTMLTGDAPTEMMVRALDVCLILQADHGFNASTFAARVTMSTLSDLYSAISTAIGTLKGPLHGGANEAVMHMLNEIGDLEGVTPYIQDKLERKDKVMGFGHRVYKAYDPRATYLKTFTKDLAEETGQQRLYAMSRRIEEIMDEAVGARGIYPNVDFYSATTYHCLGLDLDLYTPIFAMSRNAGWIGNCLEQLDGNRLIRPRANYTGPHEAPYVAIDAR